MANSLLLLLGVIGVAYKNCRLVGLLRRCVAIKLAALVMLACLQTSVLAQQNPLELRVAADGKVTEKDEVLRLEETIRGNKEQPKVLSIVPWQLPLYQRIDRNEGLWKPIVTGLKPIERGSFLKEIQLIEELQAGRPSALDDRKSN